MQGYLAYFDIDIVSIVLQTQMCYLYSFMSQQLTWVYIHGLRKWLVYYCVRKKAMAPKLFFIRSYIYYEEEL